MRGCQLPLDRRTRVPGKIPEHPRHIEFQVIGDDHGKVIHLGERECSIQRRHQKLFEESPSVVLSPEFASDRVLWWKAVKQHRLYSNAGTVEFLVDEKVNYYFMEMNAQGAGRACGDGDGHWDRHGEAADPYSRPASRLGCRQEDISSRVATVLSAASMPKEDPDTLVPSPGTITSFNVPGGNGVRVRTTRPL